MSIVSLITMPEQFLFNRKLFKIVLIQGQINLLKKATIYLSDNLNMVIKSVDLYKQISYCTQL